MGVGGEIFGHWEKFLEQSGSRWRHSLTLQAAHVVDDDVDVDVVRPLLDAADDVRSSSRQLK